jgi:chromosome segregation protein
MHLKSVQVQGFKTFAKKTELLFEPGITAIVGPNGSGKSNLVDAIRWVLGERSARELRGARMEEIVYSGGARRAGSGMAEVKLVIDNSDGRLSVPFSEVEVTRRGYRSGESDYWMNGSRCRLRDIEELFASTGVTQQGYAVVAQDDVDHIIQTTPGDRRALIEEAAGVRGLRAKRLEAIGKLKEADVSILRLGDLAAELGPRVVELRRQADAAREQREMTGRLATLRGSLLQGEWRAARQAVKKATAKVETLTAAAAAAERDSQTYAVEYDAHKERLAQAHDARLERERSLGAMRLTATHAAARVDLLTERLGAAAAAAAEAETALGDARQRLQALEAEAGAARVDAASVAPAPGPVAEETGLEDAEAAVAAAQARRAALETSVTDLRRRADGAAQEIAVMQQREQALAEIAGELERERGQAAEALASEEASSAALDRARAAAMAAAAEMETAEEAERAARTNLESAGQGAQTATAALARLEERVASLRRLAADEDIPAPSARRLVDLLEIPRVRQAAIEAGISEPTLTAWAEEGRAEQATLAGAVATATADLGAARAEATEADARTAAAREAVAGAGRRVEELRRGHVAAAAEVSAVAAHEAARDQRAEAARARLARLDGSIAARGEELRAVRARIADAGSAREVFQAEADPAAELLAGAVAAETEAEAALERLRQAESTRQAERRALLGRAEAVRGRLERAEVMLARQRQDVERAAERLAQAQVSRSNLEIEVAAAKTEAEAARVALASAPMEAETLVVETLTRTLVDMENGHLQRQVALAHHQEALAAAAIQLETDSATLADLTARMGGAGETMDGVEVNWEKTQREINRLERQLAQLGPVNELAIEEYERDGARLDAISGQFDDLSRAREGLDRIAAELGAEIDRRFEAVFGAVAFNFQETFAALFVGGKATLRLDDPEAPEPGVEILAQPAGKRMRNIKLLSGGERALTALAFILALEKVTPSPFYVFDEVDAPLDDANIKRFSALLESMASDNQFILITHNHATMTVAQALYGVTLEDSGVSRVVSVKLREGEVVAISTTG